jgi:hypothetical protein
MLSNSLELLVILARASMLNSNEYLLTELTTLRNNSEYFNNTVLNNLYDNLVTMLNTNLIRMDTAETITDKEINIQEKRKAVILFNQTCTKHVEYDTTDLIERIKKRTFQVENHERLNVLLQPPFGILLGDYYMKNFDFKESSLAASLADILLVHEYNYVESFKSICEELKSKNTGEFYKYGKI